MIFRFFSRYGLATHLALLATVPIALSPFVSAAMLGSVTLWLSAFAAVWLFTEPSVRVGEHLSDARLRVRREVIRDPMFWVLVAATVYAGIRWFNNGIKMFYNAEQLTWYVTQSSGSLLPASVADAGYLPFAAMLGALVVVIGIRHGLGRLARNEFAIAGSLIAGMGGLAAAVCACCQLPEFVKMMGNGFDAPPFWCSSFGVWLVVGAAAGAQAERQRWGGARLPFAFGLAGNAALLIFFAPPLVAVAWIGVALLVLVCALGWLGRSSSMGAVARTLMMAILGVGIPILLLMSFMPESVRADKIAALSPAVAISEHYRQMSEALSRITREMWITRPWLGVGEDAFQYHIQFMAEKADWAVLPPRPTFAFNGYWMLLASRGIVGAALIVAAFGYMLYQWGVGIVRTFFLVRKDDEMDPFMIAIPPVSWTCLLVLPLLLVEAVWSPILTLGVFALTILPSLALSSSSFPRPRRKLNLENSSD